MKQAWRGASFEIEISVILTYYRFHCIMHDFERICLSYKGKMAAIIFLKATKLINAPRTHYDFYKKKTNYTGDKVLKKMSE